jgi:hypothetical protein
VSTAHAPWASIRSAKALQSSGLYLLGQLRLFICHGIDYEGSSLHALDPQLHTLALWPVLILNLS